MTTFVSIGNAKQPFNRLLSEVKKVASILPKPVVIQYGHTPFSEPGFQCVKFMRMEEFQHCIEKARLVILHGGAGSIITSLQAGKVPVVMPRKPEFGEHIDDHQLEFVTALGETGRIKIAEDAEGLSKAIQELKVHAYNKAPYSDQGRMLELVRNAIKGFESKK